MFSACASARPSFDGTLKKRNGTGVFLLSGAGFGKGVRAMLTIHKTIDGKITQLDSVEDGCWVNLTYPARTS